MLLMGGYVSRIYQDLLGDWILCCFWGALDWGGIKILPFSALGEAHLKLLRLNKIRYQNGYEIKEDAVL